MDYKVNQRLLSHLQRVFKALLDGELVFFLGAGANLCGRPSGEAWMRGKYLPNSNELASYLAKEFHYPTQSQRELVRVSQYAEVMMGAAPLYNKLRYIFDADYPPTRIHYLLAELPQILRKKGCENPFQLIVTTNYDDVLERAFQQYDQEYDLVIYLAETDQRGKFEHYPPNGNSKIIDKPNEYLDLLLEERSVILKIHGAIARNNPGHDSFVITEDHYIDYLSRTDISSFIPLKLKEYLHNSHFLFCGYSLRDWNLRVILQRIWGEQKLRFASWAVQVDPEELDQKYWMRRDVEILDSSLDEYVIALQEYIQSHSDSGGES